MRGRFRTLNLVLLQLLVFASLSSAANYYVDSQTGNDTNNGTAPRRAWKSLDAVNAHRFAPGARILFKAGTSYTGQLKPQGSGALVKDKPIPIQVGKYGRGPLPRIDGEGKVSDTVLLQNVEYWVVQDLEITNLGTNRAPWRTGVRVVSDGAGALRQIRLQRLFVHDVNGDLHKEQEGCGIFFESRGGNNSHFDDLLIENCRVVRTDRNGICQRTSGRGTARSTGVVIRGNVLEDIGGDGIKLWGSNGGVVEHNVVRGGRMRCEDYAAGIWPFACDDTLIQFNEVSGMKGIKDGQGFDSDYQSRRSVFQYNYSHDNDGGFILICSPSNSFNSGTIVRYNISQNDGINTARVFHFAGRATETKIYNNTIYVGTNQDLPLMLFTDWNGGWAAGVEFYNNIFYVDGRADYRWGKSTEVTFENNIYFGNHDSLPKDAHGITNRPTFTKPGSGKGGFTSLDGYKWQRGAEAPRGRIIPDNGGRDFFGNRVRTNSPPTIGAIEFKR